MIRKAILVAGVLALAAATAQAQDARVEVSGTAGWTFSDGVSGGTTTVNGEDFSRIDPKDAFSWGARIGFFATPNVEVGAPVQQPGDEPRDRRARRHGRRSATRSVYNYHGYVAYNFGDADASVRPYFLGGLGATQFGTVNVNFGGVQRDIGGTTKFSTTWALGVKLYPEPEASASVSRPAGPRRTSSPTRPAGGATPTGAATPRATRSTRTSTS